MTSNNITDSIVRLHPWRDGLEHCLQLLEAPPSTSTTSTGSSTSNSISNNVTKIRPTVSAIRNGQFTLHKENNHGSSNSKKIRSVDVCFHEKDYLHRQCCVEELLEVIGQLPYLESLLVRVTTTTIATTTTTILPIADLTNAISSAPQLGYLTLIGVSLVADDYDMNGFYEVLRIHPTLQSMALKDCFFGCHRHWEKLDSLGPKIQVLDPQVVVDHDTGGSERPPSSWYQSIFSAFLFPWACCIKLFVAILLLLLLVEYHHGFRIDVGPRRVLLDFGWFGSAPPPPPPPPPSPLPKKRFSWKRGVLGGAKYQEI